MSTKADQYQCPECGLHYEDEQVAKQCDVWCSEYQSCNLEITQYSVERKQNLRSNSSGKTT